MVVDWPPVIRSVAAVLPPMAVLTVALSPYDGYFEDRRIFLFLLAGLGVGVLTAFLEVSLLVTSAATNPILYVVGTPLAAQLGKAIVLNLPRFQGEPGSVFSGASIGAGMAASLVLGYGNTALFFDPASAATTGLTLLILGTGVSLLHVATGAYIGHHVARSTPFRGLAVAGLATVPLAFALVASVAFRSSYGDRVTWALVAAVYGLTTFVYARRRILDEGLTDDQRKHRRRQLRDAS